jgi:phage replication O-like protein O
MPATFYARAEDATTSENSYNPSLCAKNKLNLLPEHIAEISMAFISQQILAPLSSRNLRILSTIFQQTIGYNKREDDMNPACLQLLSNIRGDHANEAVRRLAALNIILTRKGRYGKWMSINFDFKNWGKPPSESTTNDPSCLLSVAYQPSFEEDFDEFELYAPPAKREKNPPVAVIEEEQNTVLPPPDSPSEATPVAVIEEEESTALPPPDSPSEAIPVAVIEEEKSTALSPPDLPSEAAPIAVIKEEKITVLSPPNLPSKTTTPAPVKQQPIASTKKPEPDAFKLNFPEAIPEKLRQRIIHDLGNLHLSKKTQPLLDYFAQCLNSGRVRSPIAYFIKLKERWLKGTLELNETLKQPQSQYPTESDKKARRQQIENRNTYHRAIADVKHIKRLVKTIMEQTQTTFEAVLKEINYTQIWKKAVECLEQTRKTYMLDGG